ncbi:MAG: DegT/DnrJ/EryC1/StrS family aminotransferase [Actinomycetota bacterium]|nr:DegT/DnrJ/EryC1/StrS family aminotransferase [Actinomycetota bacterium]
MTIPAARLVFGAEDRARILDIVDRCLQSGSLTLGEEGRAFEEAFAKRHGATRAVATSSGTSALEIIMRALEVAGHEVVVPANTFFATAAAALHAGAKVRFADADAATLSVSVATVAAALSPATRVVVVVHIGGMVCPDIEAIAELCERKGVLLVEDAAHAHGSLWQGRSAGTFGRAAAFSFYPTKVIASGEGGMIVTDDEAVADEARIYRDQGKGSFLGGGHVRLGSAWRMSEIHAAIGRVHLDRLSEFITVRRRVAEGYDDALADVAGLSLLVEPGGSVRNVYKYPLLLDSRIDQAVVAARLRQRGISLSGKVYALPLHLEPVFSRLPEVVPAGGLAVAEEVCARHVCLPVHSDMTDAETAEVASALRSVLADLL